MRISANLQPRLSQLAIAARLAIGGRMVMRAPAKPPSAGPRQGAGVAEHAARARIRRSRQAGASSDVPVVQRSVFEQRVEMPADLRAAFGPAPEARLASPSSGRPAGEGREQMTDAARIAVLWRRGAPLRELRGEYGALADAVVRSLLPALDWRRAA